jgi:hypothetical protein
VGVLSEEMRAAVSVPLGSFMAPSESPEGQRIVVRARASRNRGFLRGRSLFERHTGQDVTGKWAYSPLHLHAAFAFLRCQPLRPQMNCVECAWALRSARAFSMLLHLGQCGSSVQGEPSEAEAHQ